MVETSKELQPDPAEISVQLLRQISSSLQAVSNGSPPNTLVLSDDGLPAFTPTRSALIVNFLWFFSLTLSIAASLIAIIAKEWCYSARLGRTRRQLWEGNKRQNLERVIEVLPLLTSIALCELINLVRSVGQV